MPTPEPLGATPSKVKGIFNRLAGRKTIRSMKAQELIHG